jgi:hypothetical protein
VVDTEVHEITGKYRSIRFDGKSVAITVLTGSWVSRSEVKNRFRVSSIQAIEKKPPTWSEQGTVNFRISGETPDLTGPQPAMGSNLPTNFFPYSKKQGAEVDALVDAIEDAMFS